VSRIYLKVAFAACVVTSVSCSTVPFTKIESSWIDLEIGDRVPARVLVIGAARRIEVQEMYEDMFVNRLMTIGVEAVSSHSEFPTPDELTKEIIASKANELGVDTILITHIKGIDKIMRYYAPVYSSPHYDGYYRNYHQAYESTHKTGYAVSEEVVRLETSLYDLESEELVMSAETRTFDADRGANSIQSMVDSLVKEMQKKSVLPK